MTRTHVSGQADALDSVGLAESLLERKKKAVREEAAGPRRPGLAVVLKGLFSPGHAALFPATRRPTSRLSLPAQSRCLLFRLHAVSRACVSSTCP